MYLFIDELEYIDDAGDDFFNGFLTVREYARILDIAREKASYDCDFRANRISTNSYFDLINRLGYSCGRIRKHL